MKPATGRGACGLLLCGLFVVALLGAPVQAFATKTLGLSSGSFRFDVAPGGSASGQVVISNDGNEPINVLVYAADQAVDASGNVTYTTPNRSDLNLLAKPSSWAQITMPASSKSFGNTPYVVMQPGDQIPIKFTFTIPPDVAPGDHDAMLFFEMFDLPKPGSNTQSQVSGRLGARVTLRVSGTISESLEVRPFVVPQVVVSSSVPYALTVRNNGNVDERVTTNVYLFDRNGTQLSKQQPIKARLVFAHENIAAAGNVVTPGLFGQYVLRAEVVPVDESGQPTTQTALVTHADRGVWVVARTIVFTAVAVCALLVLAVVWFAASGVTRRRIAKKDAKPN